MQMRIKKIEDQKSSQKNYLEIENQRQSEIKHIQNEIVSQKKGEAFNRKKERMINDRLKYDILNDHVAKNQEKRTIIKMNEEYVIQKSKMNNEKKVEMGKMEYLNRMQEEKNKIAQKEKELRRMEALESELIQRLKNTQTIQSNAFQELENALKITIDMKNPTLPPSYNQKSKKPSIVIPPNDEEKVQG